MTYRIFIITIIAHLYSLPSYSTDAIDTNPTAAFNTLKQKLESVPCNPTEYIEVVELIQKDGMKKKIKFYDILQVTALKNAPAEARALVSISSLPVFHTDIYPKSFRENLKAFIDKLNSAKEITQNDYQDILKSMKAHYDILDTKIKNRQDVLASVPKPKKGEVTGTDFFSEVLNELIIMRGELTSVIDSLNAKVVRAVVSNLEQAPDQTISE